MTDYKAQIDELTKKLDPANVKPAPQGKYGDYIEGWHAIAEANRIFGFDGWSYDLGKVQLTNSTSDGGKHRVGYLACVTVVAMGQSRSDVGHGQGFGKSEGDAHDSAVKEAVTDALKRAMRSFGNPFGLALYDRSKANVGVDADDNQVEAAINVINKIQEMPKLADYWKRLNQEQKQVASDQRVIDAKNYRKSEIEERDQ